ADRRQGRARPRVGPVAAARQPVTGAARAGARALPVPSTGPDSAVSPDPAFPIRSMKPQIQVAARTGRLVYVIGPSGSGNDTIITYARQRLGAESERHVFARRHITRPAESGGEDHIGITTADFDRDRAAGRFALSWRGNGLGYGVGVEIDLWLQS